MDKTTGTSTAFHSQSVSPCENQTTISELLVTPAELSQRLETVKSVYFMNTSTSTTNLPQKEPIRRLRPELSTTVKTSHHIELPKLVILNRNRCEHITNKGEKNTMENGKSSKNFNLGLIGKSSTDFGKSSKDFNFELNELRYEQETAPYTQKT